MELDLFLTLQTAHSEAAASSGAGAFLMIIGDDSGINSLRPKGPSCGILQHCRHYRSEKLEKARVFATIDGTQEKFQHRSINH